MLRRSKADKDRAAATEAESLGTVLIVNDDEDACELLCRVVERAGGHTRRAGDADRAVALLQEDGPVRAVVLDLPSTGPTSFLVLEAIRQRTANGEMPAVMMIATTSANRTLAFDSGVDEFLTRPFHVNEFLTALQAMLALSPDERAARRQHQSLSSQGLQDL